MSSILLIEDDYAFAKELTIFLKRNNFSVEIAENEKDAIRLIRANCYDICLLDIGLPDCSGFELCKKIRLHYCNPVIMLTAYDSEDDIVNGLQSGADDYVTKPCSLRILHSRISSQLRRKEWFDQQEIQCLISGELKIDLIHRMIFCQGEELIIGDTEFELCIALIKSGGRIMPRELLLDRIWDEKERFVENNTLSVYISRLRKKLGLYCEIPYIDTVKGIGYRWNFEVMREII